MAKVKTPEQGTQEFLAELLGGSTKTVLGLSDVMSGKRVLVPTTVYEVSNDDTSGVAGLLFPSGEFIAKAPNRSTARYWEFEETDRYSQDERGRVSGYSWRTGELVWTGHAADIEPNVEFEADIYETVELKTRINAEGDTVMTPYVVHKKSQMVVAHKRGEDRNAMTGEWVTTGELERAMERGTSMAGGARTRGRVHTS